MVTIATIQTWLYPRVNLWSGVACLVLLVAAYHLIRRYRLSAVLINQKFMPE